VYWNAVSSSWKQFYPVLEEKKLNFLDSYGQTVCHCMRRFVHLHNLSSSSSNADNDLMMQYMSKAFLAWTSLC